MTDDNKTNSTAMWCGLVWPVDLLAIKLAVRFSKAQEYTILKCHGVLFHISSLVMSLQVSMINAAHDL